MTETGDRVRRRILLVRHGETEGESSIRFHGRNDVALSDVGRVQMRRLTALLAGARIHALVTSPLSRARESAELLLERLDPFPEFVAAEDAFQEIWFGRLEGLTEAEIAAAEPQWYAAWCEHRAEAYPDGESFDAFALRVARAFDSLVATHPDGDLLIVAHKGVVKRILMHTLSLSLAEVRPMPLDLASLSTLHDHGAAAPQRFALHDWNRTP